MRQATGPFGYGKPESGVWGNGLLKGMRLQRQGCGAAWLTPPLAPAAAPRHENSPASPAFPALPGLLHPCVHPVLLPWHALSLPPGWNQDDWFQAGRIRLMKALDSFDTPLNVGFFAGRMHMRKRIRVTCGNLADERASSCNPASDDGRGRLCVTGGQSSGARPMSAQVTMPR